MIISESNSPVSLPMNFCLLCDIQSMETHRRTSWALCECRARSYHYGSSNHQKWRAPYSIVCAWLCFSRLKCSFPHDHIWRTICHVQLYSPMVKLRVTSTDTKPPPMARWEHVEYSAVNLRSISCLLLDSDHGSSPMHGKTLLTILWLLLECKGFSERHSEWRFRQFILSDVWSVDVLYKGISIMLSQMAHHGTGVKKAVKLKRIKFD